MSVFVKVCSLCAFLACFVLSPAKAQKNHRLSVRDLAGYYVTNDRRVTRKTLTVSFAGELSKPGESEVAYFTGKFGDAAIVGQGGIDREKGYLYFIYPELQDETYPIRSVTIMEAGRVVGLLIDVGYSPSGVEGPPVKYRRVSHEAFVRFQRTHGK